MTAVAVVHYVGATQKSRSVVASIVSDFRSLGDRVTVLDIGNFGTVFQDFPPEWAARLVGHRSNRDRLSQEIRALGASEATLDLGSDNREKPPTARIAECEQAIHSELLTYFRQETLNPKVRYVRWMRSHLTQQAYSCYSAVFAWLAVHKPEMVLIPNGRTSRQKMCRVAAEELGIPVKFYENGRATRDSYYLGTTQPHDRLASQAEVEDLTKHLTPADITKLAQDWLAERVSPASGTNSFSSAWSDKQAPARESAGRARAVFFSSSADEFLAFGPMWNIDQWESQFQAFDMVMERLSKRNIALVLRVHPNLTGKSRTYFRKTVKEIQGLQRKYPLLVVHWHNSPVNSYDLAKTADFVIAERSTIALEANLMGKPVWINQAAQWDLVADVRQILMPSDVTDDALTPWAVDSSRAERFVAYWSTQEHPLRFSWQDWSSWDPEKAPLVIKLAALLSKNPLAHKLHLLILEWGRWRNNHARV